MEFWSSQKLEDEIMKETRNLSLVMDFYELTMSQCYFCLLYTSCRKIKCSMILWKKNKRNGL